MPSLQNPVRKDAQVALHQLEIEEAQATEVSEREARRMMYRPPSYIRLNLFAYVFTLIGLALVGLCVLARYMGWVK